MFNKIFYYIGIRITLLLAILVGCLGVIPVHASPERMDEVTSLSDFLNVEGTLKLDGNTSSSFQADSWEAQLIPLRGSIFSPKNREAISPLAATIPGNWSALGSNLAGMDGALSHPSYPIVNDIVVNGTDIYVSGCFNDAGGDPTADNIAKWDGTKWTGLGRDILGLSR